MPALRKRCWEEIEAEVVSRFSDMLLTTLLFCWCFNGDMLGLDKKNNKNNSTTKGKSYVPIISKLSKNCGALI